MSYCSVYYHYSTCDSCMLQYITHHYDCYNSSHLCVPNNIRSAECGPAATVDSKGHNAGFCWPHHCATGATTSVPDNFSGICLVCHGPYLGAFSLSKFSLPPIHYIVCWWLLQCFSAFRFSCGCHIHQWGLNC